VGPFGRGLALLFSERFRFIAGHDCRRIGGRFEPHPLGKAIVSGRKCIPWMHHPYVPHAILERGDDGCDWVMVMGAFGPSHDWGDGTEANFPQYAIRKAAKDRRGKLWEDGVVLELSLGAPGGEGGEGGPGGPRGSERRLADFAWQLRHRPGLLELVAREPGPIERVQLSAPSGERAGRVRLVWRASAGSQVVVARARFLAKRLTVAPADHKGAIDVLDAPFGFQRFEEHRLAPRSIEGGLAFDVPSLSISLFFAASGGRVAASSRSVDPHERTHGGGDRETTTDGAAGDAPCWDATLTIARDATVPTMDLAFGVVDERDSSRTALTALRAPIDATARDLEGDDGTTALRLESGDRWLDGLLRWSRHVAHAIVAPNGVVMTGALGYSAKCHVGQDVPFVLPLFLLDPHPRLRGAARRMLEYVVTSPSAVDGRGILDHPCEGLDFAFLPMRPRAARVFRRIGAAGLFRWILVVEQYLAATGDRELAARALALFAGKVERHYLPFSLENTCWNAGEETQELAYTLPTAFDGLRALQSVAEVLDPLCAARLAAPIDAARTAIRAHVETPLEYGGMRLAAPVERGGVTLEPGWIASPSALSRDPPWFGFDLPLIAGHALVHGVLSSEPEQALARRLADPCGPFRVRGAGLSKSPGGEKGVWFWHGALAAKGLARAGFVDAAFELLGELARGVADVNGLGVPGEETNGGDYAMGIGALAGLALVETLLGLRFQGDQEFVRPTLPSSLDGFVVRGLSWRGRELSVEVVRRGTGPLVAREERPLEAAARSDGAIFFELA